MSAHESICIAHEIIGELRNVSSWLAEGELNTAEFARTISALEVRRLKSRGFYLQIAISRPPVIEFLLRESGTDAAAVVLTVDTRSRDVEMFPTDFPATGGSPLTSRSGK